MCPHKGFKLLSCKEYIWHEELQEREELVREMLKDKARGNRTCEHCFCSFKSSIRDDRFFKSKLLSRFGVRDS